MLSHAYCEKIFFYAQLEFPFLLFVTVAFCPFIVLSLKEFASVLSTLLESHTQLVSAPFICLLLPFLCKLMLQGCLASPLGLAGDFSTVKFSSEEEKIADSKLSSFFHSSQGIFLGKGCKIPYLVPLPHKNHPRGGEVH